MNTIRMIVVVLPMTLLLACGGGGGGGGTAAVSPTAPTPPTDDGGGGPTMPTEPQDLPTALIADTSVARNLISGSTSPTTTMPMEIQAAFEMEAVDANTLIYSDAFVNGEDISAGGSINLGGFTFSSSLDDIKMGLTDRFDLTRFDSQYTSVMDHQGVMLAQYQAAGRTDDNDVFEYRSYGGWLTNSAFSVDMLTIDHGSREDSTLVGVSYGDATRSRPEGKGNAIWLGSMVGMNKNSGNIVQGGVIFEVVLESHVAETQFHDIYDITANNSTPLSGMSWTHDVKTDGTFSSTANGNLEGTFYGMDHEEVGGTFNRAGIIGAFGGKRMQ